MRLGGVILAAGKGKRMQMESGNKVTATLDTKPMILHIVHFMKKMNIQPIVVVIGHEKDSVKKVLEHEEVLFAEQTEQLGTGHALATGVGTHPNEVDDILVVYGDDAVLYVDKNIPIIEKLIAKHTNSNAVVSFLTITVDNPFGLGRIIRNESGELLKIVEEKDATEEEREINEINPGCFIFNRRFIEKYKESIEKSPVSGEYYINNFIDLALENNERVETVQGGKLAWRGVNTKEELQQAENLFIQVKN